MKTITILRTEAPQFEQQFKSLLQRKVETAAEVESLVKEMQADAGIN